MKRPSQYGFETVKNGTAKRTRYAEPYQIAQARRYAKAMGHAGAGGGWIYDSTGQHLAHGWSQYYFRFALSILAWLENKNRAQQ